MSKLIELSKKDRLAALRAVGDEMQNVMKLEDPPLRTKGRTEEQLLKDIQEASEFIEESDTFSPETTAAIAELQELEFQFNGEAAEAEPEKKTSKRKPPAKKPAAKKKEEAEPEEEAETKPSKRKPPAKKPAAKKAPAAKKKPAAKKAPVGKSALGSRMNTISSAIDELLVKNKGKKVKYETIMEKVEGCKPYKPKDHARHLRDVRGLDVTVADDHCVYNG